LKIYDAEALTIKLSKLSARGRAAFACSCAERTFKPLEAYLRITNLDQIEFVRASLDASWISAIDGIPLTWSRQKTRAILALVPQTPNDDIFELWTSAENAVPAIVYAAWSHQSHRTTNAVWAAGRTYEMNFYAAEDYLGHQPLDILNASDLVQLELTRQEQDFQMLQNADTPQTYAQLKVASRSIDVLAEFKNGKGQ
jgi:hypothetical protein